MVILLFFNKLYGHLHFLEDCLLAVHDQDKILFRPHIIPKLGMVFPFPWAVGIMV